MSLSLEEASRLLRVIGGAARAGESVKGLLRRIAAKTGLTPSRTKHIWYGEARTIHAAEMDRIRAVARAARDNEHERIARDERAALHLLLARIERRLDAMDAAAPILDRAAD